MINARSGGNNINSAQMHQQHHHQQRQLNHFQGQSQHQQQQRHLSHNNIQSQQQMNRNQQQQQRPQRPPNQQQQSQSQQMRQSNQNNHNSRPNSGTNINQQVSNKPNSQQQQQQQPTANGPPLPPVLPKGWKREEIMRTKGISAGLVDVVYIPQPNSELSNSEIVGKKFRTKLELRKCLVGSKYDTTLLDFKTGKLSQIAWRRQRRMKSIAANPSQNYASAAKYDTYLNVPVRQQNQSGGSALKQSVFCVTNNHRNDPTPASVLEAVKTTGPNGQIQTRAIERPKPIQLFWELRFNDLKGVDVDLLDLDNINEDLELENIPKFKNFPTSDETIMRSVAASWYLNQNKILLGQEKDFSKNARIFIERDQPLIPQTSIKEDEIKQQESKVKEMRKKLQQALDDLDELDRLDAQDELNIITNELEESDTLKENNNNNNNNKIDDQDEIIQENKTIHTSTDMKPIECN